METAVKKSYCLPKVIQLVSDEVGILKTRPSASREGNGNPVQYSCLENPMDRGAWQATVIGSQRVRHD